MANKAQNPTDAVEQAVKEVIDYFAFCNHQLTLVSISREVRARGFTDRQIGSLPEQLLAVKGYVRQGYVKVSY